MSYEAFSEVMPQLLAAKVWIPGDDSALTKGYRKGFNEFAVSRIN